MTGSEDHQGSYAMLIAEVSHARAAIIADLAVSCAPALTVPETAGGLPATLAELPDPRARGGVRHRLPVVVTAAVCAVIAGYRSYAAIAEWVADAPDTTVLAWASPRIGGRRRR